MLKIALVVKFLTILFGGYFSNHYLCNEFRNWFTNEFRNSLQR